MLKSPCLFRIFPTLGNQVGQSTQTTSSIETTLVTTGDPQWLQKPPTQRHWVLRRPYLLEFALRPYLLGVGQWENLRTKWMVWREILENYGKIMENMGTLGKRWAIFGKYGKIIYNRYLSWISLISWIKISPRTCSFNKCSFRIRVDLLGLWKCSNLT
jgi:hypothetical protein